MNADVTIGRTSKMAARPKPWRKPARFISAVLGASLLLGQGGCIHAVREIAAPRKPDLSAAAQRATLQVGNLTRSYLIYAPANLPAHAPLLFVLHGSGQEGAGIERSTGFAFDRLADRHGFVVIYPDGYERNWDDCRKTASYPARRFHVDDKAFLQAIVARAVQERGVDPRKIFAMGHSNGAQMAYRLALEQPDEFAGVAVVSAGLPTPDNMDCMAAGKPVPIMIINGTQDPLNPYGGGEVSFLGLGDRGTVLSTEASADYFARLNGQTGAPTTTQLPHQDAADPTSVEEESWTLPGKAPVVLYSIREGGHVVPQPYVHYPALLGRQTKDLDAPAAIWNFFSGLASTRQ